MPLLDDVGHKENTCAAIPKFGQETETASSSVDQSILRRCVAPSVRKPETKIRVFYHKNFVLILCCQPLQPIYNQVNLQRGRATCIILPSNEDQQSACLLYWPGAFHQVSLGLKQTNGTETPRLTLQIVHRLPQTKTYLVRRQRHAGEAGLDELQARLHLSPGRPTRRVPSSSSPVPVAVVPVIALVGTTGVLAPPALLGTLFPGRRPAPGAVDAGVAAPRPEVGQHHAKNRGLEDSVRGGARQREHQEVGAAGGPRRRRRPAMRGALDLVAEEHGPEQDDGQRLVGGDGEASLSR